MGSDNHASPSNLRKYGLGNLWREIHFSYSLLFGQSPQGSDVARKLFRVAKQIPYFGSHSVIPDFFPMSADLSKTAQALYISPWTGSPFRTCRH